MPKKDIKIVLLVEKTTWICQSLQILIVMDSLPQSAISNTLESPKMMGQETLTQHKITILTKMNDEGVVHVYKLQNHVESIQSN